MVRQEGPGYWVTSREGISAFIGIPIRASLYLYLQGAIHRLSWWQCIGLFWLSGAAITPLEVLRTQLACDVNDSSSDPGNSRWLFTGPVHAFNDIWNTRGLRGLFSGYAPLALRETINISIWLLFFPKVLVRPSLLIKEFLVHYGIFMFDACLAYPLDTVCRRIIIADGAGEKYKYQSMYHAFKQIIGAEGCSALFYGIKAHTLRLAIGAYFICAFAENQWIPGNVFCLVRATS